MRISYWSSDVCSSDPAELVAVDGYRVRFFLELLPATGGTEPELPITAAAFDQTGNILAEYTLENTTEGSQTKQRRGRSEARRVGKECVSTCSSRWSP